MDHRVIFRDFEERDVDFVFETKNNKDIFKLTVDAYRQFSYEEAVLWVKGCMKTDSNYRFWAICTNDSFQRIVGWCSLTNIDPINRCVYSNGMIIADHEYNDGLTLYETHRFLLKYVFEELKYNRVYATFLSENELLQRISSLIFDSVEGVMKQAVYRNGTYHDITITAMLRNEYLDCLSKGKFELQNIQELFIDSSKKDTKGDDLETFISLVINTLDDIDPSKLTADTKFRELPEWSSLNALLMISMVNEEYKITLTGEEFASAETLTNVLEIINSKRA